MNEIVDVDAGKVRCGATWSGFSPSFPRTLLTYGFPVSLVQVIRLVAASVGSFFGRWH